MRVYAYIETENNKLWEITTILKYKYVCVDLSLKKKPIHKTRKPQNETQESLHSSNSSKSRSLQTKPFLRLQSTFSEKKAPHTRSVENHTTRSSNAPINHHIVISPFYSVGFGIERYHSQERIQSTSMTLYVCVLDFTPR